MIDINTLWNDTKIKLSARLQAISYEVWIENWNRFVLSVILSCCKPEVKAVKTQS